MIIVDYKEFIYVKFPDGTSDTDIKDEEIMEVEWRYRGDMSELFVCLSLLKYNNVRRFVFNFLPHARQDKRAGFGSLYFLFDMFIDASNKTKFDVYDCHNISSLPTGWDNTYVPFFLDDAEKSYIVFPDENAYKKYNQRYCWFKCTYAIKDRDRKTGEVRSIILKNEILPNIENIFVIDDICDGGKTFIELAKILPKRKKLSLYTTYGIYSKGKEVLEKAGYHRIKCQYLISMEDSNE